MTLQAERNYTAAEAIATLVASEGDLDLAAEILYGLPVRGEMPPKGRLLAILAEDPEAFGTLQKQLRTLALLQTFQNMGKVSHLVQGTLSAQAPSDLVKLYGNLLNAIGTLTDDHKQKIEGNFNSTSFALTDVVLRQLPPEVREALKALIAPASSDDASAPGLGPIHDAEYTELVSQGQFDLAEDSDA